MKDLSPIMKNLKLLQEQTMECVRLAENQVIMYDHCPRCFRKIRIEYERDILHENRMCWQCCQEEDEIDECYRSWRYDKWGL